MADGAPDIVDAAPMVRAFVRNEAGEQFVVFPTGFRIDAQEVVIRREGDRLLLEPVAARTPPLTRAEWAAHWSEVDRLRGEERLIQPERETDSGPGGEWR